MKTINNKAPKSNNKQQQCLPMTDIFHQRRRWWEKKKLTVKRKKRGKVIDSTLLWWWWGEQKKNGKKRGWHRELWQSERSRDHLMTDWLPGDANNSPLRRRRKRCRPEFLKEEKENNLIYSLSPNHKLSLSSFTSHSLQKKFGEKRGKSEREANICPLRDQGPSSLNFFIF